MRSVACFASVTVVVGCLAGCLPYRGDAPRDLNREDRDRLESGGGVVYESVESDALDGRSFEVEVTEAGTIRVGEAPLTWQDELTFAGGRMETDLGREHGYSFAPYEVKEGEDGSDAIWFRCKSTSGAATTEWTGTVWHDKIAGTAVTTEPGRTPVELTFKSIEPAPTAPAAK